MERFFNETALVDLTRDDKMNLYRIFDNILLNTSFLESVQKMHSAFLPGFLQLVEQETDPQCLMLCFSMYQIVVKHFPLGVYAEDMFEYPAAYFPIDFNAVSSVLVNSFSLPAPAFKGASCTIVFFHLSAAHISVEMLEYRFCLHSSHPDFFLLP